MIELEPTVKQELLGIHKELMKKGELYSNEALQGYYDTFRHRFGTEKLSHLEGAKGIIVAEEFDKKLKIAVTQVNNVRFVRYKVKFDLEQVE